MANTTFETRIKNKYDSFANWNSAEGRAVVLLKGEIAVVEVPVDSTAMNGDTVRPQYLIKVGDGTSTFDSLPWLSAKAGDVYAWAKAANKPSYTASEIGGLADYINGEIQDTNTTYKVVQDATDGHKFTLQAQEKGASNWTVVSTITIPDNNTTYTLTTGTSNGTVKFNGTDVAVRGLKSAAYTESSAYDAAGTAQAKANAVLGTASDAATANTVYGAKAAAAAAKSAADAAQDAADAAQSTANAAMPKAGGTFTGAVTLSDAPTADLQAATKKYVDDKATTNLANAKKYTDEKTAGLTGSMHFKGAVTVFPPTSGTYASGDVVLYNSKEYVYDGTEWHELGDEGSHVLKTQTINGHALSGNITLTADDVGAATASDITAAIGNLDVTSVGGSGKYIQSISETDGKIAAVSATLPTALKNPNALTVGSKTYDGSAAVSVVASDLGLAAVATSGKIDNLSQTAYVIFDCGTASTVI